MRIEADHLYVDYNGIVALFDASLRLPAGCICGLVGMNGAGKSTLFKCLTGFVRPSRGRVLINGQSVAQAQRHQAVAYVPQNEGIDCSFPISVWEVVMMGRYGAMNLLRLPRRALVLHVDDRAVQPQADAGLRPGAYGVVGCQPTPGGLHGGRERCVRAVRLRGYGQDHHGG